MKNIKVSVKLVGGFILTSLVVLLVGLIGVYETGKINEKTTVISQEHLPGVESLMRMRSQLQAVATSMRTLLSPYLSSQERNNIYATITEERGQYKKSFDAYERLPKSKEEAGLWREFSSIIASAAASNDKALQLSKTLQENDILNPDAYAAELQTFRGDHYKLEVQTSFLVLEGKQFEGGTEATKCNFGKWLSGYKTTNPVIVKLLEAVRPHHTQFHESVVKIKAAQSKGDTDGAKVLYLQEMTPSAEKTMELFRKLREEVQETQNIFQELGKALLVDSSKGFQRVFEHLDTMVAVKLRLADEAAKEAEATASTSRIALGVGIVVGLFLALGLGLFLARAISLPVATGVRFAQRVAAGDLDQTLDIHQKDEIGILSDALRTMVSNLKAKIAEANAKSQEAALESEKATRSMATAEAAQQKAEQGRKTLLEAAKRLEVVVQHISSSSQELSTQVEQSSRGAERQAARVGETATSMEEMNATVLEVARNASESAAGSEKARKKAQEGAAVVQQSVQSIQAVQRDVAELKENMSALGRQAEGISSIMNVISDIADQTNLLALNAAIEAARAGEAGRGFAVVADEVRKLAEKTMTATKEVGEAIGSIQNGTRTNMESVDRTVRRIEEATDLASKSGEALKDIVSLVEETSDQVRSIATASEEQSAASEEINKSIEDISRISSQTSQAMAQSALAVTDLARQTQELQALTNMLVR